MSVIVVVFLLPYQHEARREKAQQEYDACCTTVAELEAKMIDMAAEVIFASVSCHSFIHSFIIKLVR